MELVLKKTRRRYSEREKAAALAIFDSTGNLSEASRISGIPDSTIHGWLQDKPTILNSDVPLLRAGYERPSESLADKFESIAHQATGEISTRLRDPETVKEIPIQHLLKASEVGAEKSQLLRGLPTSITDSVERQELVIILQNALEAGAIEIEPFVDVTPELNPAADASARACPVVVSAQPAAYEFRRELVDG